MRKKLVTLLAVVALFVAVSINLNAQTGTLVQQSGTDLAAATICQNYSTAGGTGTITITPPSGQYAYIVSIDSSPQNGSNTTATVGYVTTTNLPGTPKWSVTLTGTATTAGTGFAFYPAKPLKSTAAASVTVVTPTGVSNATWNVNTCYYFAP